MADLNNTKKSSVPSLVYSIVEQTLDPSTLHLKFYKCIYKVDILMH